MKILKHGNQVKEEKVYICPTCGCEFIPGNTEVYYDEDARTIYGLCPECMTRVYDKEIVQKTEEKSILDRYIDEILDYFDFEKVHEVMLHLDWKWASIHGDPRVPTVDELKQEAEKLLREAWENKTSLATGGFYVTYHKEDVDSGYEDGLELNFQIDGCAVYLNQVNNMVELF